MSLIKLLEGLNDIGGDALDLITNPELNRLYGILDENFYRYSDVSPNFNHSVPLHKFLLRQTESLYKGFEIPNEPFFINSHDLGDATGLDEARLYHPSSGFYIKSKGYDGFDLENVETISSKISELTGLPVLQVYSRPNPVFNLPYLKLFENGYVTQVSDRFNKGIVYTPDFRTKIAQAQENMFEKLCADPVLRGEAELG